MTCVEEVKRKEILMKTSGKLSMLYMKQSFGELSLRAAMLAAVCCVSSGL